MHCQEHEEGDFGCRSTSLQPVVLPQEARSSTSRLHTGAHHSSNAASALEMHAGWKLSCPLCEHRRLPQVDFHGGRKTKKANNNNKMKCSSTPPQNAEWFPRSGGVFVFGLSYRVVRRRRRRCGEPRGWLSGPGDDDVPRWTQVGRKSFIFHVGGESRNQTLDVVVQREQSGTSVFARIVCVYAYTCSPSTYLKCKHK